ncbi:MAG TPA: cupin domain-containing protein [Dehalococcoidia bacterium]|nr:cupin domain-containing protein [Dehalococcoidia bacterium]HEX5939701.1 cupin domain-containing protein [Dehalococcoidia bacterium]
MTVNLQEIARELSEPWQPRLVAEANGFQMKVVRLSGEFPWHKHEREDELFYCLEGAFRIELEGAEPVSLRAGTVFVVPAGAQHRPVADEPALAVLFEREETTQHGD